MEDKIKQLLEAEKIPCSEDYRCPKCSAECPDEEYYIESEKYPKYYNKYTSFYGNIEWDEVHKCPRCKTLYYFNNGN